MSDDIITGIIDYTWRLLRGSNCAMMPVEDHESLWFFGERREL
jgi:hypothetical protein